MVNYLDIRNSFLSSYNWNLAHSFGLANNIITTVNNDDEVPPEYLYDLHLTLNTVLNQNRIFNSNFKTRLPIKDSELEEYSMCLRIITYKSIKGILNEEDMAVLKTICNDFSSLGALHSNDNRISLGEYNQIRSSLQLFSGKIDAYQYIYNNRELFK